MRVKICVLLLAIISFTFICYKKYVNARDLYYSEVSMCLGESYNIEEYIDQKIQEKIDEWIKEYEENNKSDCDCDDDNSTEKDDTKNATLKKLPQQNGLNSYDNAGRNLTDGFVNGTNFRPYYNYNGYYPYNNYGYYGMNYGGYMPYGNYGMGYGNMGYGGLGFGRFGLTYRNIDTYKPIRLDLLYNQNLAENGVEQVSARSHFWNNINFSKNIDTYKKAKEIKEDIVEIKKTAEEPGD